MPPPTHPLTAETLAACVDALHAACDAARLATLRHFRSDALSIDNKDSAGAFDPVTDADREAEAAIRAVLAEARPGDAIVGEEDAPRAGTTGLTWVIDPIDGTRAFVCGTPSWGVLIALNAGGAPFLGAIDQPYLAERLIGGPEGARLHRSGAAAQPIRTRPCAGLAEARLLTTFPEVGTAAEGKAFRRVADEARMVRYGLDCYGYALVAMGQVDLVIEAGLAPYDIQGPMAVVTAAGGIVTDWRGGPAEAGGQVIAAGDLRVHRQALALLADAAI